jgi:hypothetical protein
LFRRNESTLFRYLCAQVKRQPIINGKPDENAVKYDDCYLLLSVGLCVKMRTGICMRDGKTGTRSVQGRRDHNLVTNSPRPSQTEIIFIIIQRTTIFNTLTKCYFENISLKALFM